MEKRLKVVWLCHFSNNEFEKRLKPIKHIGEFAPWIPMAIDTVREEKNIELHVISAHPYINGIKKFDIEGVHYYFYNPYIPYLGLSWPSFFRWDYISNFSRIKRIVGKLVDNIKPDIVHLFGAENHDYSPAILPIVSKYPVILTVQGFCSHTVQIKNWVQRKRCEFEQEILKKIRVVFYERKQQRADILKFNPDAITFWHTFASYEIKNPPQIVASPKYDISFWGRVDKDKGIVDLIDCLKILKDKYNVQYKLNVMGGLQDDEYPKYAESLGVESQINWAGFLPTRMDVFQQAVNSRLTVLPTYHDVMPGTIMESMFLKVPVISYATDSIPEINEDGEAICLVKRGDKHALAESIYSLLNNRSKCNEYSEKAYKRAYEMFAPSNECLNKHLLGGYKAAVEFFKTQS